MNIWKHILVSDKIRETRKLEDDSCFWKKLSKDNSYSELWKKDVPRI